MPKLILSYRLWEEDCKMLFQVTEAKAWCIAALMLKEAKK